MVQGVAGVAPDGGDTVEGLGDGRGEGDAADVPASGAPVVGVWDGVSDVVSAAVQDEQLGEVVGVGVEAVPGPQVVAPEVDGSGLGHGRAPMFGVAFAVGGGQVAVSPATGDPS